MFTPQLVVLDITQKCTDYKIPFDKVTLTISYTVRGISIGLNGSSLFGKNRGAKLSEVFRFFDVFRSLEDSFWRFTSSFGLYPENFRKIVFQEIYRIHTEKQRNKIRK